MSAIVAAIAVVFTCLPDLTLANQSLTPYTAEYKVKISVVSGKLFAEFRQTDEGFMARSVVEASGIAKVFVKGRIEESSWFTTDKDGVVPSKYKSIDEISSDTKVMDFSFDWAENQASGTINDQDYLIDLEGMVHDRVSIQYELMFDLLNDLPSSNYVLLNEDELRPILVSNIGTKQIKVPYGKFDAVGIQHNNEDLTRITILWCVKELGYLPVLIEQYRDGKRRVKAELKQYSQIVETASVR